MKGIPSFVFSAPLAICLSCLAQPTPTPTPQAAPTPQATPAPQATPLPQAVPAKDSEPDLATLRAMKSKVFVIQHRDPSQLQMSLELLGSAIKGSKMNWTKQDGTSTITVRDLPENLGAIEEALKRLDVPVAVIHTTDVELHLHVLFASKSAAPDGGMPEELRNVLKSLKGTLSYRNYTLAASFVQRTQTPSERGLQSRGLIEQKTVGPDAWRGLPQLVIDWSARGLEMEGLDTGLPVIRFKGFLLNILEQTPSGPTLLANMSTDLTIKEGDMAVVGTSIIKDSGLIVVLMARRVN
jgi:hypothetical protein